MKKAILFFTALLFASSLSAQSISGGLRAGIQSCMHLDQKLHGSEKYTTFTKEAFIRAQSKRHWALELNPNQSFRDFGTTRYSSTEEWSGITTTGTYNNTVQRYDLHLKAEYAFSCPCCHGHCCSGEFFKNYIGIVAGPSFINRGFTKLQDGNTDAYTHNYKGVEIWGGLSNTLEIKVSKHLVVSGNFSWLVNFSGGSVFGSLISSAYSYALDNRFSGLLGLGYKF